MNLSELIDFKINLETTFTNKLLEFDCFFQDHLWNGFDEENDPKFITNEDFEAIEALSDKMKHMIFNIGCPNSIEPMLNSIIERKIKHWQNHELFYGGDAKHKQKGYQLKSKDDLNRARYNHENIKNVDGIIKGHFRWNNRGYILSRRATDLLNDYYQTKF